MADTTPNSSPVVREVRIQNEFGIHARPAAMFVKTANRYACEITVEKKDISVSGKSIMGLLTIEGNKGCTLRITAIGHDAEAAVNALADLVNTKFNEE